MTRLFSRFDRRDWSPPSETTGIRHPESRGRVAASLRRSAPIVSLLALLVHTSSCGGRVPLTAKADEIGSVWVDPDVTVPNRANVVTNSAEYAPYGIIGLVLVLAVENAEDAHEDSTRNLAQGLKTYIYERFVEAVVDARLLDLSEDERAENRLRVDLVSIDLAKPEDPILTVEIQARLTDAKGDTLWHDTQKSRPFRTSYDRMDDYAYDAEFRQAALRCAVDDAVRRIVTPTPAGGVLQGPSCESAYTIVRRKREEEAQRLDPLIKDTKGAFGVTCRSPYHLARDCSNWHGPRRQIRLGPHPLRVAGSSDGKIVLVGIENQTGNTLSKSSTAASRSAAFAVLKHLAENGVSVESMTRIESSGQVFGFILELDADGYSILMQQSVR